MFPLKKEDLTTSYSIKVDSFPLGHQKWDKTSKARCADDPKFFCWWGSVPRNLWLPLVKKTKNLLSSATARVQKVLRQCTHTKPVSMLLHSYVASCTVDLG